jgi:hypothetical protein
MTCTEVHRRLLARRQLRNSLSPVIITVTCAVKWTGHLIRLEHSPLANAQFRTGTTDPLMIH